MATNEFWQMMELRWQKEEERCKKMFEAYGRNHSYSTSEIRVLRRLKLIPPKL